jgi:anti-sigma B factor antagonist
VPHSSFAPLNREVQLVLNLTSTRIDGVIVVYVKGALFFGEESACLRTLVKDLLHESLRIVLDLGGVTHIDSGGVGSLVAAYVSARQGDGNIKFANLSAHAKAVLRTTNLLTLFEIFATTNDAVESFKRPTTTGA